MDKKELQVAVERGWHERAKVRQLKPKTAAYRRAELEFFVGAMHAINAMAPNANRSTLSSMVPPIWVVNAMSGRPIAEIVKAPK